MKDTRAAAALRWLLWCLDGNPKMLPFAVAHARTLAAEEFV
jgi:hypothetical protein